MSIYEWFANLFEARRPRKSVATKNPHAVPFVPNDKEIDFVLNDMSMPDFRKKLQKPEVQVGPKFTVGQFKGGGFKENQVEFQAANCYVTVANTLNYMNSMTNNPLTKWAGSSNLQVLPRAGNKDINAFYNRKTLSFFYFNHSRIGKTIYTADSAEIIAHELGHALLDSWRPETWGKPVLEIFSIHEAFADLTGMLHALTYREIIEKLMEETGGDLRKENVVSRIAEDVGVSIFKLVGNKHGHTGKYLRSAINDFKYVNPRTLPKKANQNQLAAEPHSFGRIFLGAFYDILVMIYEDIRSEHKWGPIDSMARARDQLTKYVIHSIHNAPINTRFYNSFATTMLWSDVTLNNRKYHDRMQKIFFDRNILEPKMSMLAAAPKCDNESKMMVKSNEKVLKLNQHFIAAQTDNPLYALDVEMPMQSAYFYDNDNNPIDVVHVEERQAIEDLSDAIEYLHHSNSVSDEEHTPFAIQDGKLVRTCFSRSDFEL